MQRLFFLSTLLATFAAQAASPETDGDSIYVVQRRAYSKSGRIELTPMLFSSINNNFVGHVGGGLSVAYHMRESLAVELVTTVPHLMHGFYSDLVYEVRDLKLAPELVDLKQMSYFAALALEYSALYGKLEFEGVLVDYDVYFSAGTGYVRTLETCQPNRSGCGKDVGIGYGLRRPDSGSDADKFAGSLGVGTRVFFSDWFGVRVEVRDLVYSDRVVGADGVTVGVRNNVLCFVGGSFLLPGFR